MGKSTISMAIFNSFLYVYQRIPELCGVLGATVAKVGESGCFPSQIC